MLLTLQGNLERVTGIEPAWPAWKAGALPLSYTRVTARGYKTMLRPVRKGVSSCCSLLDPRGSLG